MLRRVQRVLTGNRDEVQAPPHSDSGRTGSGRHMQRKPPGNWGWSSPFIVVPDRAAVLQKSAEVLGVVETVTAKRGYSWSLAEQ